jgi:hypothetical protein
MLTMTSIIFFFKRKNNMGIKNAFYMLIKIPELKLDAKKNDTGNAVPDKFTQTTI